MTWIISSEHKSLLFCWFNLVHLFPPQGAGRYYQDATRSFRRQRDGGGSASHPGPGCGGPGGGGGAPGEGPWGAGGGICRAGGKGGEDLWTICVILYLIYVVEN